jgi:uncharacterized OB-fold protein
VSELQIQRCRRCGTAWFPDRLRCPQCGGREWHRVPAGEGIVEEETSVRRPPAPDGGLVRLGSVRLDAGPVVIARLEEDVGAGRYVRLDAGADGSVRAR